MDINKTFASHEKSKYWSNKNKVKPEDIPLFYYKKYWFDCNICLHEFETNINSITRLNTWCSYCSNKKLCIDKNCKICFDKSFKSNDKSVYWSEKNKLLPREVFKNCSKKFLFKCEKHGEFEASCNNVSQGKWCKKCGLENSHEKQKLSYDEFINRSKEIHGDIYDYSEVILNGVDRNVKIICKIHGIFEQTPYHHYRDGNGCQKCGIESRTEKKKFTKEMFIEKSNIIHNNIYDYSNVNYIDSQTFISIICKSHGEFIQIPNSHLQGYGCKKCGEKSSHDKQRLTIEEFIKRSNIIHKNVYDYTESEYVSGHEKILIKCLNHGIFKQDPYNHMKGVGCPKCVNNSCSKIQIIWLDFISIYYNIEIQHYMNKGEYKITNSNYKADGYCKEINTIYEFHGCLWHGCKNCFLDRTFINPINKKNMKELFKQTMDKKKHCIKEGYKYVSIWECKWKNVIKAIKFIQRKFREKQKIKNNEQCEKIGNKIVKVGKLVKKKLK